MAVKGSKLRLGVNIDHIATLRQARREDFPDPVALAKEAIAGGADGIVCHLREDRRHINDADVKRLHRLRTRLDLEMAATPEMLRIALGLRPDMVTLVPEKRQEITTEGGLDVVRHYRRLKPFINKLKAAGITVSLFIDPEKEQVKTAALLQADFIELHTGKYARSAYVRGRPGPLKRELAKIKLATKQARAKDLRVNAGHGLDYRNVRAIARLAGVEELNIGFSIIARSVVVGLRQAVKEMRRAIG